MQGSNEYCFLGFQKSVWIENIWGICDHPRNNLNLMQIHTIFENYVITTGRVEKLIHADRMNRFSICSLKTSEYLSNFQSIGSSCSQFEIPFTSCSKLLRAILQQLFYRQIIFENHIYVTSNFGTSCTYTCMTRLFVRPFYSTRAVFRKWL